jgi:hydroxypyruvate reductase
MESRNVWCALWCVECTTQDVIGDDLSVIGSGPTAADPSSFRECLTILEKYNLLDEGGYPPTAAARLRSGAYVSVVEDPFVGIIGIA